MTHDFLLRNLDEHTVRYFKKKAKQQGRSLQSQFHIALAQTIQNELKNPFTLAQQIRSRFPRNLETQIDSAQLIREDRTR